MRRELFRLMLSEILNLPILLNPVVLRNGLFLHVKGEDETEASDLHKSMPLPQDLSSLLLFITKSISTGKFQQSMTGKCWTY